MSSEKKQVTGMILNVDLKCSCCYNKVRKLLCKFPQITCQLFDEKKNKVMITVVCCDPEKFRDMLCCKGRKVIQSIEIPEQEPPPTPPPIVPPHIRPTTPPPPVPPTNCKPESIKVELQVAVCCQECYEGRGGGPCHHWSAPPPPGPCYTFGYGYGYRPPCYYVSEENPQGCSIM